MWQTWQMSQSLRKSPSELLRISNPIHAYYFDKAVWRFGTAVEADLNAASEKSTKPATIKAKQAMIMAQWLGKGKDVKGMYKDPAKSV